MSAGSKNAGISMEDCHGNTFQINSPGQVFPFDMKRSHGNVVGINSPSAEVVALQNNADLAIVREFTRRLEAMTPQLDSADLTKMAVAANELLAGGETKSRALAFLQDIGKAGATEAVKGAVAALVKHFMT